MRINQFYPALETVKAMILPAPADRRVLTASLIVAPEVKTSSTRIIFLPVTSLELETAKQSAVFSERLL